MSATSLAYAEPVDVGYAPRPRYSAYVRPAPPLEPPYDPPEGPGYGQLRVVDFTPPAPPLPFERPAPRKTELGEDFWGPQPTGRGALPDPRPFAAKFLQAAMETLVGRRAPGQLQHWTSPRCYADLMDDRRHPAPHRAIAPTVTSVHVSEPADGVAEVAAVVRRNGRFHAVAARLEGVDGRWRCVQLQLRKDELL
jgi:uncharacterized protein DUF6459